MKRKTHLIHFQRITLNLREVKEKGEEFFEVFVIKEINETTFRNTVKCNSIDEANDIIDSIKMNEVNL